MPKDRLAAFTDAILAIIMTILVLELEKPAEPSFAAVWALRQSMFSYVISFFWLGAMWVNLHGQWNRVDRIDNRVVWWSVIMLFFASLIPYVTDFVGRNYMNRFAQGCYLVVVLCVSLANIALNRAVGRANPDDTAFAAEVRAVDKIMWIDIGIKCLGFILSMTVYPPLAMIFVIVAGVLPTTISHIQQKQNHSIETEETI